MTTVAYLQTMSLVVRSVIKQNIGQSKLDQSHEDASPVFVCRVNQYTPGVPRENVCVCVYVFFKYFLEEDLKYWHRKEDEKQAIFLYSVAHKHDDGVVSFCGVITIA